MIVSLAESADDSSVLHILSRCEADIAEDRASAASAFDLSMQLMAVRGSSPAAKGSTTTVSLSGFASRPLLITRGSRVARAALRLCCQAACSALAGAREEVLSTATEGLHDMLKANGGGAGLDQKQHLRDFVLTYCIDVLRHLQDKLQRRWSPAPGALPHGGGAAAAATTPEARIPSSSAISAVSTSLSSSGLTPVQSTPAAQSLVGAAGGGEFDGEERYRIKARALYAILKGVIDMHPTTCTQVQRCSRSMVVEQLQKDHNIVQHIIEDVRLLAVSLAGSRPSLTRSTSRDRFLAAVASPMSMGPDTVAPSVEASGAPMGRSVFIGSECWARLEFLRFFLETSDAQLKLSTEQALSLWNALQESSCETACCWFRLLQDAGGLLEPAACEVGDSSRLWGLLCFLRRCLRLWQSFVCVRSWRGRGVGVQLDLLEGLPPHTCVEGEGVGAWRLKLVGLYVCMDRFQAACQLP